MKNTYPIVLTKENLGFTVYIPDFDINTQGDCLTEAIEMARDAIGLMGIDMEDDKKNIPNPSAIETIKVADGELLSLVDVDFAEYRRKNDIKFVRKNCTIPNWLCIEAEKANINFSALLQKALRNELNV